MVMTIAMLALLIACFGLFVALIDFAGHVIRPRSVGPASSGILPGQNATGGAAS